MEHPEKNVQNLKRLHSPATNQSLRQEDGSKEIYCDISPLTVETLALQFLEFPVRCADVWNYAKSFLDSIFLVIKD